jgi:PTS system cellobiose-specific IIC component
MRSSPAKPVLLESAIEGRRIHPVLAAVRRFSAAPPIQAINAALPWSFAGLAAGLLYFMWAGSGTLAQRFASALIPAFAPMSIALLVLLAIALARRVALSLPLLLAASTASFMLCLPRSAWLSFGALTNSIGASGLFLAITVIFVCAFTMTSARALPIPASMVQPVGALGGLLIFVLLFAAGISLGALLQAAIAPLADLGDTATALLVITFIEVLLWTVGIHGPALLAPVITPLYLHLVFANFDAFTRHQPIPHIVTVSTFLFVFPGGVGATLGLVALLARSRIPRVRRVALAALVPSIFNINEPLLFSLPIVFNPILAIPFIVAPMVLAVITYVALAAHWVDPTIFWVPSTMPTVLAVVLATKDWRAFVLVCVNIIVATLIYVPFIRWYEHELEVHPA